MKRAALPRSIALADFVVVPAMFGAFKDMVTTRYQNPSYLRFYCDNDAHDSPTARYQLVPDRADDPTPNSRKTLNVDQEWFDQYNYMRVNTRNPFPCQYRDPEHPDWELVAHVTRTAIKDAAFTYNGNPLPADMQQDRSVITVSSRIFIRSCTSQIHNRYFRGSMVLYGLTLDGAIDVQRGFQRHQTPVSGFLRCTHALGSQHYNTRIACFGMDRISDTHT